MVKPSSLLSIRAMELRVHLTAFACEKFFSVWDVKVPTNCSKGIRDVVPAKVTQPYSGRGHLSLNFNQL